MKKNAFGFTLIELLVSLTLLSFVILIAMGLLFTTNIKVKETSGQRRVMDNLDFALEHMSRSITYGSLYSCYIGAATPNSCPAPYGTQVLSFTSKYLGSNVNIVYERSVNTTTGYGYISRTIGTNVPVSLTDEQIDIQELSFYVYHSEPYGSDPSCCDEEQPRVTIVIKGASHATDNPQDFFIQTTLSQRDLKL